jgi:hypothetical protein
MQSIAAARALQAEIAAVREPTSSAMWLGFDDEEMEI